MLHSCLFGVQEEDAMKKLGLITACLLVGATPALAQTVCTEPAPPTAVGENATGQQLAAFRVQVIDFRDKSDVYQTCIANDLEAKTKAATAAAPLDPGVRQVALAKVAASQAAKEKWVADLNTQILAYQKRNPR
jgi:hypothetical protein